ncbi:MAG: hypothetical protein FJX51_02130 [Alphaproteobacteria bacterium]|nr:hypothetical protein [Alphaproteobacteria bacterium]
MTADLNPAEERMVEFLGRHLDGDLDRAERRELARVLATDPEARRLAGEVLGLDARLDALAKVYDRAADVPTREAGGAARKVVPLRAGSWRPFGLSATAMALRAAALGLVFVLGALVANLSDAPAPREGARLVQWGGFQSAADARAWDHSRTLAPGESVVVHVRQGGGEAFHLRAAAGAGTVSVSIVHQMEGGGEARASLAGAPVHYAALMRPETGEKLVLRNDGATPVEIYLDTPGPTDAEVTAQKI